MPRELLHWQLVDEVILPWQRAHGDSDQSQKKVAAAAMLGSIAHDVPYFARRGPGTFDQIGERLHGTQGEDTASPLRLAYTAALHESNRNMRQILVALMFGMASHSVLDSHWHPMVFERTGDYYDLDESRRNKARHSHYVLEGWIDEWSRAHHWAIRPAPSLSTIIAEFNEQELTAICLFLARMFPKSGDGPAITMKDWHHALVDMARLHRRFQSSFLGYVLSLVRPLLPAHIAAYEGLFIGTRRVIPAELLGTFTYNHPVTSVPNTTSFAGLYASAREEMEGILNSLATAPDLLPVRNVSLCLNMPNLPISAMDRKDSGFSAN